MDPFRVIELKQSVFADNDADAELLRKELKEKNIFLVNLMSSPGAGKTTTLTRLIDALKDEFSIGIMEADIDSDVDAETIARSGVKVIQLHTGGMCHLDADMTRQGIRQLDRFFSTCMAGFSLSCSKYIYLSSKAHFNTICDKET